MPGASFLLILYQALTAPFPFVAALPLVPPQIVATAMAADSAAQQNAQPQATPQQPTAQQANPQQNLQQQATQQPPATQPAREQPAPRQDPQPAPDRWAAAVDLGFASSSGNSSLTSLTTGIRIKHLQTKLFKLEWSASLRYGESQGEVVARNLQSKLDFDVGPQATVAPFVFASAERDPFRRLDLRARTGSGVKYTFYREKPGEASLRVAAQYSRENFTSAANQDPRTDGAWSMEFKGNRGLGNAVKVENTTTFAPVFDDFEDYNLEVGSKVSSRISKHLALTLTHAYSYDSTPAANVGRTDQRFQAGLTIDF